MKSVTLLASLVLTTGVLVAVLSVETGMAHEGHVAGRTASAAGYAGLESMAVGPCAGVYRVTLTGDCTHGPDPDPTDDVDPVARTPSSGRSALNPFPIVAEYTNVECIGNGTSGKRVQVLYVRASNVADGFAANRATIGATAVGADRRFRESAAVTFGTRRLRFVHDSACNLSIENVVIGVGADDTWAETTNAVKALGYDRVDRKYLMFVDISGVTCGTASWFPNDDEPGPSNSNNAGPSYSRLDLDDNCKGKQGIAAHELMHALGSVQTSAPNWNGGGHCLDDYDKMCYDQEKMGFTFAVVCPDRSELMFDCKNDDYFHTNPPAGSYLDTHWNTADSDYLEASAGDHWGFVRADDPVAASYAPGENFNQNSTGGTNTIVRISRGKYEVTFLNLAPTGGPKLGSAQATAYGSGGEHCTVSSWRTEGPDTTVTVLCFDAAGTAVDATFDASYVRSTSSQPFAYLLADKAVADSYSPSWAYQYNSTGQTNTITRNSTGDYTVRLRDLGSSGGTVKVTAFGVHSNYCKAKSWESADSDELVDVLCFDSAGDPVDEWFTLVYADRSSILANEGANGYVWADHPTEPVYTPTLAYQYNSSGATNTITRTAVGLYTVTLPGLGNNFRSASWGTVHVTAHHTTSKRCEVAEWRINGLVASLTLSVDVACHTAGGAPADSKFVLQFTT